MDIEPTRLISQPVPDLTLPSAEGDVTLRNALGPHGLLLHLFHATWCPACVEGLMRLQRRYRDYADAGVAVLAIVSDSPASAQAFQLSADPPLTFPLLADPDLSLGQHYGLIDTEHNLLRPAALLLDEKGHIRYVDVPDDPHDAVRHDPLLAAVRQLSASN